jgi:hypothetical protein
MRASGSDDSPDFKGHIFINYTFFGYRNGKRLKPL